VQTFWEDAMAGEVNSFVEVNFFWNSKEQPSWQVQETGDGHLIFWYLENFHRNKREFMQKHMLWSYSYQEQITASYWRSNEGSEILSEQTFPPLSNQHLSFNVLHPVKNKNKIYALFTMCNITPIL